MITDNNFKSAISFLKNATLPGSWSLQPPSFEGDYANAFPVATALKILHRAAIEGSTEQQRELLSLKERVVILNSLLKKENFVEQMRFKMKIDVKHEMSEIEGMQIALPRTFVKKMVHGVTKVPRVLFVLALEAVLFLCMSVLLFLACFKPSFNPKEKDVKVGKTPILLLHGSNFNESQWIIGRLFLNKPHYGSVFSLSYDGWITNDANRGIEDYAGGKIREEIKRIKALTKSDELIIVGHSMGGMVGSYYAEHFAEQDGVRVEHVISIASPWRGTPTLGCVEKISRYFSAKRFSQMSLNSDFRKNLVEKALTSERLHQRKYYDILSTTDYAVPHRSGSLTENPGRQSFYSTLGHIAIVAVPSVWQKVNVWLEEIYLAPNK